MYIKMIVFKNSNLKYEHLYIVDSSISWKEILFCSFFLFFGTRFRCNVIKFIINYKKIKISSKL